MAGWTAGGWLAENTRHPCRLFHLVVGQLQLLHHLLQILLVHLTKYFVKLSSGVFFLLISTLEKECLRILKVSRLIFNYPRHIDADPDPPFHVEADPDPTANIDADPAFHSDADLNPDAQNCADPAPPQHWSIGSDFFLPMPGYRRYTVLVKTMDVR